MSSSSRAKHLLIITTARCKSTIIARLLAGEDWAELISEPFTKAYYGAENVEYNSEHWPNDIESAKQFIYQRVAEADIDIDIDIEGCSKPIVLKTLAYQAINAFMDIDFLNWIKDHFYILYLVRDPMAVAKSIAHQLIKRNIPPDCFVDYIGMSQLHSLSLILPPDRIVSVKEDIDIDPLTFVRECWSSAGHPEIKIDKLPNLPHLDQKALARTGLDVWPSWYKRAINTVSYQSVYTGTPDKLPRAYDDVVHKYLETMEFYYDLLIQKKRMGKIDGY